MRTLRTWALRLRGLVRRDRDERDFADQIEADLDLHTEDGIRAGMTRDDARRAALLKLGGRGAAREAWRDRHGVPFLEALTRDVVYACRMLGRNRGWTAVAIVSLALGVGANTAVFSAVNSVLLRRLPVPAAGDLVTLRWKGEARAFTSFVDYGFVPDGGVVALMASDKGEFSIDRIRAGATGAYQTFQRLKAANSTLEHLFAIAKGPTVNLIVDGEGDLAVSQFVSGEFYSALRVPPAAGRPILPMDDRKGAEPVAVISDRYWDRRFKRNPAIIGKEVRINTAAFTIVGVSGAGFPNVLEVANDVPDIAIPLANEPAFQAGSSRLDEPTNWWLVMMGRLKPGVTAAQVQANLSPAYEQAGRDGAAALLATLPPEDRQEATTWGLGQRIPSLKVVSGARGAYDMLPMFNAPLAILGVLAGIVLLVVCANLANLSLALTTTREREIAVRRALGATRRRLVRQILTEHVVMAVFGGAASLLAAWLFQHAIGLLLPSAFDWTVVAFAFAAATATGIAIGVLPALRASRAPERAPIGGGATSKRPRLAAALLVAQVAMSLALLVGAGLFLRTLVNLRNVDPGFDTHNLVLFTIEPRFNQYDDARAETLYEGLTASLRAIPGVASVAFSSHAPLDGNRNSSFVYAEGAEPGIAAESAFQLVVQQDFFETMAIPFRMGRPFTALDGKKAPQVAVINAALARTLFGDANPLGRRFGTAGTADRSEPNTRSGEIEMLEVVGVVGDTRHTNLRAPLPCIFYRPHLQSDPGPRTFEVRTLQPPEALMPAIRKVVQARDPALPILAFSTEASAIANHWRQERIVALASGTLGGLALTVSVIGLFGVMSYTVARRTKDIGIRMALGAHSRGVLRSVLRESLMLAGAGILLGLATTLATTRFLEAQLFGLSPNDPAVIVASIGVMLSVAVAAGYLPARRAAKVDPMVALRHE